MTHTLETCNAKMFFFLKNEQKSDRAEKLTLGLDPNDTHTLLGIGTMRRYAKLRTINTVEMCCCLSALYS